MFSCEILFNTFENFECDSKLLTWLCPLLHLLLYLLAVTVSFFRRLPVVSAKSCCIFVSAPGAFAASARFVTKSSLPFSPASIHPSTHELATKPSPYVLYAELAQHQAWFIECCSVLIYLIHFPSITKRFRHLYFIGILSRFLFGSTNERPSLTTDVASTVQRFFCALISF